MAPGREKGSAFVELTICLPVLLVVLAGLIEFGVLIRLSNTALEASWFGARVGAFGGSAAAEKAAKAYLEGVSAGLSNKFTVTVTPVTENKDGTDFPFIQVRVKANSGIMFAPPVIGAVNMFDFRPSGESCFAGQ